MGTETKESIHPHLSFDDLATSYEEEKLIEAALAQAKEDAEQEKYEADCDALRPYILDALFEDTNASLDELHDALERVDFTYHRGKVAVNEIVYPKDIRATLTFYGVVVDANFVLEDGEQVIYNRSGAYKTSAKSFYSQPKITAYSFPELLHKCRAAQAQEQKWQQEQAEREAAEEREYEERQAQQQAEKDEVSALVNFIKEDRVIVRLLQALIEYGEARDYFEQELYHASESWDRCAESSAASLGDLQTRLEATEYDLRCERDKNRELECDLDEERRQREREQKGW